MHNNDEKYSSRPGFKPATSRLQGPVDTNGRPLAQLIRVHLNDQMKIIM